MLYQSISIDLLSPGIFPRTKAAATAGGGEVFVAFVFSGGDQGGEEVPNAEEVEEADGDNDGALSEYFGWYPRSQLRSELRS